MKKMIVVACTLIAMSATPALAQDNKTNVSVGVAGGTLGIGPEVGVRVSNTIGIRGNATFLNIGANFDSDDLAYDGDLRLRSFGAMVDVYPFGGGFRLSAGARINSNRARLEAKATGDSTVDVGDETYTAAEVGTLTGRAKVKRFAPALTLGWGGSNRKGFVFGLEAGALFQGSVRVQDFTATGTLRGDPEFQEALRRERNELQDDVNKYKVYPILMASIGWRF